MKRYLFLTGLLALSAVFTMPAFAGDFFDALRQGKPPLWKAGATVVIAPEYEGSDDYKVIAFPYIFPSFGSAAQLIGVRGSDDIRFKILKAERFEAGPLAGYRFDREEDDGPKLVGLGDVDGGLVLGGFARIALLPQMLYAGISYHRTVTGDVDGGQLRFGLEYETEPTDRIEVFARAGATYADGEYMEAYFGVDSIQAANSAVGLQEFEADAGFKDVYAELGTSIMLSERWTLKLNGRYARLIGDAADSPIIETDDQFSGSAGMIYTFGSR